MKKIIPQIKFKSLLDGLTIEQKNEKFFELSAEGKRLEIAWDVLKLVTSGVMKASDGFYWDNETEDKYKYNDLSSKELCEGLNKIKTCTVCARGGLMISRIRLGNKYKSTEIESNGINYKSRELYSLIDGFSESDLYVIERAYEYNKFNHPYMNNTEEKLANIMCNILVNGKFNTKDKNDYLIIKD
jgi:hypothetical protein